jgi:preprotein translocase subunit SecG
LIDHAYSGVPQMLSFTSTMLAYTWGQYLLAFMLVMVCMLLILVVLLQKGRGEGLAGAFGGSSGSAFGAKTGDVFTWVTVSLFVAYMGLSVWANYAFVPSDGTLPASPTLSSPSVPATAPPGPAGSPATLPITITPEAQPPAGEGAQPPADGAEPGAPDQPAPAPAEPEKPQPGSSPPGQTAPPQPPKDGGQSPGGGGA